MILTDEIQLLLVGLLQLASLLSSSGAQSRLPHGVQITTSDVRIEYCDDAIDLVGVSVHVKLIVENHSKVSLILARKLGSAQENLQVADLSGAPVYAPYPTMYGDVDHDVFGDAPDDATFEIIKPGASVVRDFPIGFEVSKDSRHPYGHHPPPGTYRVSASRTCWPYYIDEARAIRVRDKWKRYGLLLSAPIRVDGVRVEIALPKNLPACEIIRPHGDKK